MVLSTYLWIVISVLLSAVGQCLLKVGAIQPQTSTLQFLPQSLAALTNTYVIAGLCFYVASVVFWVRALRDADLSLAYPFVGIGIVLTMAFSIVFLDERLSGMRVMGTLLVAAGVAAIAKS